MGKIKASIEAAAYRVAPKSVKKKMDATLAYKTSKNMESYYGGAAIGQMEKGDNEGAQMFLKGRAQEVNNPARSGIPRKKARKIDSSKAMKKESLESWRAGNEYYGRNQNLSPKQF
jgi:hypothetical protein